MPEKDIVFLNGEFLHKNEAKISIFDRGFIFGDAIYEVVPIIDGVLVDMNEFLQRLKRNLKSICIDLPYTQDELIAFLKELISKNKLKEGGLYIQVSRGVASRDFAFTKDIKATIMAFVYEAMIEKNPLAKSGVNIIFVPELRWKRRDIKSTSLLAQCYAKEMVKKAKAYEGFFVENSYITEGISSSVFIIKNKILISKPLSNEILLAIRRGKILRYAKEFGLKVQEKAFTIREVYEADEVFISAATLPILAVVKVEDKLINNGIVGEFSKKLRERYIKGMKEEASINKTL